MSLSPTSLPEVTNVTAVTTSSSAPVSDNLTAASTVLSPVSSASAVTGPVNNTSAVSVPLAPATPATPATPADPADPVIASDATPASIPTDDSALSFYKSENVRESLKTALHGDVPMTFRTHAIELSISGRHWGGVVRNHELSSFFTSPLSPSTSSSSSSSSSSVSPRPFTARITVQYPDGAIHTVHTDAVAGLNDPDFTHRIQVPALAMPDSQAFARRIVLDITACCGDIPFAVVRNIRLVDLLWELVLLQRPMTLFVGDKNNGGSGGSADGAVVGMGASIEDGNNGNDSSSSAAATGTNTNLNSSMFLPVRRENSWREAFYRMKLGPIVLVDPASSSSSSSTATTNLRRNENDERAAAIIANMPGILQAESRHRGYAVSRLGNNTRSDINRNVVPTVTIRVVKGCCAVPHSNHIDSTTTNNTSMESAGGDRSDGKHVKGAKSKKGADTDDTRAVSVSLFKPPCIIDPSAIPGGTSSSTPPSSSRCSLESGSSSVTSSSASSRSPSSLGTSPQLAVGSISQTPSTLRKLPLLPPTEAAGSEMSDTTLFPFMSPFTPAYFSAGRLVPPLVPTSANTQPCVADNKRVIFDVTIDRIVMQHRYQTCTHLSLSTTCEKGGQLALVSIGCISSHARSSSSSSTSSHPSAALLTHLDSTFSCNLSCSSHALAGEHLQRVCRLQTVCIDNGRRHYLGFCQFRLDHIALEHKRLVQWHMRGRQGLSTLLTVTKFVHCQSFIHVSLSIGNAATCVRRVENPALMYDHLPSTSGRDARTRTGILNFKKRHGYDPQNPQNQQSHKHRQQVTKHNGLRSSWESVKRKLHVAKNSLKQDRHHNNQHEGLMQTECDDGGINETASVYSVKFPNDGASLG